MLRALYNCITRPLSMHRALSQLNSWIKADRQSPRGPVIAEQKLWAKKCRNIIKTTLHDYTISQNIEVIESFYNNPFQCLRELPGPAGDNEIILLVTVKNDKSRIEHFLKHYRQLGIKHFAFIDNGSDDGTVELVLEQDDTACFQTKETFQVNRKEGWFNRIAAHYGTNRWYIVVDSDELLVYPGMKDTTIDKYLSIAANKGFNCLKTIMIDVYPDSSLMDKKCSDEEYLEKCVYFDRDGYVYKQENNSYSGGMRTRLFSESGVQLTKPTIINFKETFLNNAHDIFPKSVNLTSPFAGAVLHYKFLPSDRQRYIEFERTGVHFDKSKYYKDINKKLEHARAQSREINAMCEYSVRFDKETFTQYLPFIKDIKQC